MIEADHAPMTGGMDFSPHGVHMRYKSGYAAVDKLFAGGGNLNHLRFRLLVKFQELRVSLTDLVKMLSRSALTGPADRAGFGNYMQCE